MCIRALQVEARLGGYFKVRHVIQTEVGKKRASVYIEDGASVVLSIANGGRASRAVSRGAGL